MWEGPVASSVECPFEHALQLCRMTKAKRRSPFAKQQLQCVTMVICANAHAVWMSLMLIPSDAAFCVETVNGQFLSHVYFLQVVFKVQLRKCTASEIMRGIS